MVMKPTTLSFCPLFSTVSLHKTKTFRIEQFSNDCRIAIATLSDWLKRLTPVFQPMRIKTKTNRTM